jgi:hypothetical protein
MVLGPAFLLQEAGVFCLLQRRLAAGKRLPFVTKKHKVIHNLKVPGSAL